MRLLILLVCLAAPLLHAQAVPPALQDWREFVLRDKTNWPCPVINGDDTADTRFCAFYGPFSFDLGATTGQFSGVVTTYRSGRVALPGGLAALPLNVRVDGRPQPVTLDDDGPGLTLDAGEYRIDGEFRFERRPERLPIPESIGQVRLRIDGKAIEPIERNDGGLWLGGARQIEQVADTLTVQVHRLLSDGAPQLLTTQVQLDVAGRAREVTLASALPPGFVATEIDSDFPARLGANGTLYVQVQPGRGLLELTARSEADQLEFTRSAPSADWPEQEVWSYRAEPTLRTSIAQSANGIDPKQAGVPGEWQALPAFVLGPSDQLSLDIQKQATDSANRLSLQRTLWLDFDGSGFTAKDSLTGQLNSGWRLNLAEPFALKQASVDGEPALITRLQGGALGVELRQTQLNLNSMARATRSQTLPISGWDQRLDDVSLALELPPGWRLIAAPGADRDQHSWIASWTLFDVFIVALTVLMAARAAGWKFGALALTYLLLANNEPGAPVLTIFLLSCTLLVLRVAGTGRLQYTIKVAHGMLLALLVIIAVPLGHRQISEAMHPQLERNQISRQSDLSSYGRFADRRGRENYDDNAPAVMEPNVQSDEQDLESVVVTGSRIASAPVSKNVVRQRYATGTMVQAGIAEPDWSWRRYELGFQGPVLPDQEVSLWLASPLWVRAGKLALLLALTGLIVGFATRLRRAPAQWASAALVALLLIPTTLMAQSTPSDSSLQGLHEILTKPPTCLPDCMQLETLSARVDGDRLELRMAVHSQTLAAFALPGDEKGLSDLVVERDGVTLPTLRDDGLLWVALPRGVHPLRLSAKIVSDQVNLHFPSTPAWIDATADGFDLSGLRNGRLQSDTLTFTRRVAAEATTSSNQSQPFAPFVRVYRRFDIGLDWTVETRVVRLSPRTGSFSVRIPRLTDESISDSSVQVTADAVVLDFAADATEVSYASTLTRPEQLQLVAPPLKQRAETWEFAIGESWHATFDGLSSRPASQSGSNQVFDPLPGDTLTIAFERPQALPGNTVAIDSVNLSNKIGRRSRESTLQFSLRATQGGQHTINIPASAEILALTIDGSSQSLRNDAGALQLPIRPGAQQVQISWREDIEQSSLTTSAAVDLHADTSNMVLRMEPSYDRWLLWTSGPTLGPVVRYWPLLALLLVVAVVLARLCRAPLGVISWVLLALAFSTVFWPGLLIVATWLTALDYRGRHGASLGNNAFNLAQTGLVVLTGIAMIVIIACVPYSLLERPNMQIVGNQSSTSALIWFADRSDGELPTTSFFSLPVLYWRLLMLAWALWLASSLVSWLRWGWAQFNAGGSWRATPRKPEAEPLTPETATDAPPPLPDPRVDGDAGST